MKDHTVSPRIFRCWCTSAAYCKLSRPQLRVT